MRKQDFEAADIEFMRRCISVAQLGISKGEYPFAAVITRRGELICEAYNMVRSEGDVTRHAEMVVMSDAQRKLQSRSLEECTLYSIVEPCAMCSYAIRETRLGRVISGLRSPIMGGYSRWDILPDRQLSSVVPEVFARPPEVRVGCLHDQVRAVFRNRFPLLWRVLEARKIFVAGPEGRDSGLVGARSPPSFKERLVSWARPRIFDRFGRL